MPVQGTYCNLKVATVINAATDSMEVTTKNSRTP